MRPFATIVCTIAVPVAVGWVLGWAWGVGTFVYGMAATIVGQRNQLAALVGEGYRVEWTKDMSGRRRWRVGAQGAGGLRWIIPQRR